MKIYHWRYKGGSKPLRDRQGRFSSFKKIIRRSLVLGFMGFGVWLAFNIGVAKTELVASETLESKVEGLKRKIVEDIRNCERANYTEDDAPIILDTNKKMSIGTFMYQKSTVQHYWKKYHGEQLTGKEATLLALDESRARQLTYDILFKEREGWKNWYNCSVKHGIAGRIGTLRELES